MPNQIQSKIFSLSAFQELKNGWIKDGQTLVFTNGVFDIVHKGHIDYLFKASQRANKLIIGLNSDASVKRLNKGEDRPINKEEDRAFLLAAFGFVDAVIVFDEDTPIHLIESIKPNVLVKGGDYDSKAIKGDPKYIVGSDIIVANGGHVDVIPFLPGYSSTNIIEKIRNFKK